MDPSRESHNLRAYKQKCQNAYYRGQTACQNYKKLNGKNKEARELDEWHHTNGQLIKSTDGRGASRRASFDEPGYFVGGRAGWSGFILRRRRGAVMAPSRRSRSGVNGEHVIAERDHHDTIVRENEANFDEDVSTCSRTSSC